MDAEFSHLEGLKRLAEVARAKAHTAVKQGRASEAVELILLQLRIAQSLRHEPHYISYLARNSILHGAVMTLEYTLNRAALPEDDIVELSSAIDDVELHDSFKHAILGERAMGIMVFDHIRAGKIGDTSRVERKDLQRLFENPIAKTALAADETYYLNAMDEWLKVTHTPYREIAQKHAHVLVEPDPPRYALLSLILLPVSERGLRARDARVADVSMAMLALSLHSYKQQNGGYPDTLSELQQHTKQRMPVDPFSGKDFVYKRQDGGYMLYSVGHDLRDNGGKERDLSRPGRPSKPPEPPKPSEAAKEEHYDMVWKVSK